MPHTSLWIDLYRIGVNSVTGEGLAEVLKGETRGVTIDDAAGDQ